MKILMLCPNSKLGTPANERFQSFLSFFKSKNAEIDILATPLTFFEYLFTIVKIFKLRPDYIFISQPPFNFWMLFFIPFIKIILDIRDGWSIGVKTGYGGTVKPKWHKYPLICLVEWIMINKSYVVITCTYGLKNYLLNKYKKDIVFFPNGISSENKTLIDNISYSGAKKDEMVFSCAGQFSEYGKEKVKKILETISLRYNSKKCLIQVIGADEKLNAWILDYICVYPNLKYKYIPRVNKEKLYLLLKSSDFALAVIRDPSYDYGTKIYEYIACQLKVINYFSERNNFTDYFYGNFDIDFVEKSSEKLSSICREDNFFMLDKIILKMDSQ